MKQTFLLLVVMGFALSFGSGALAQQFRWVDKDGRVQYGDTPPPGVKATRLKPPPPGVAVPSGSSSAAKKDGEKGLSPDAAFRKRQQEREAEEKKGTQTSADAEAKRQNCEAAQASVRSIQSGQRISTVDRSGERIYLDDTQVASELARAQQAVTANCN